jgi:hypothetical protein
MISSMLPQLDKIGHRVSRWRAELLATWSLAIVFGILCVLGLADFWLRLGRTERLIFWGMLVVMTLVLAWRISAALRKRFTAEGVAAMIERRFPQLDNHLINYLQFSRDPDQDPFKAAYVRRGAPKWQSLDLRTMRDRKSLRRSRLTLLASAVILLLPAFFWGDAWGLAIWRTINPFTSVAPVSLTHILKVSPGAAILPQGEPLVLACTVKGFRGHEVRVEVNPGDADPTTYALGRITEEGEQGFSHRLAKVSTHLRYRFRAGDAPDSEWFTITTRPPTAFTGLQLTVTPPPYTKRRETTVDPRHNPVNIPFGSTVTAQATSNTALKSANLQSAESKPVKMLANSAAATHWQANTRVLTGSSLRIEAQDPYGKTLQEDIAFALIPDTPPVVEISSPGSRSILPPGEAPRINFHVTDDYGLGDVVLEEVQPDSDEPGRVVKTWPAGSSRELNATWVGEIQPVRGHDIAFRITAHDQRPESANESKSSLIVFALPTMAEASKERAKLEQQAVAGLHQLIELQKQNLAATERNHSTADKTTDQEWQAVGDRQQQIRDLTNTLLIDSLKPLGALTPKIKTLYLQEMTSVVSLLRNLLKENVSRKRDQAWEAIGLEKTILASLTRAESSFSQSQADRHLTGIAALLEALIRGQDSALAKTRVFLEQKAKASTALMDAQDALAEDLSAFLVTCRNDAEAVRGTDPAFAATLEHIATKTEQLKVHDDMVLAAERLQQNNAAEAITHQQSALTNLKTLSQMVNQVRIDREGAKRDVLLQAVTQAKEKLVAIKADYQKKLAAMDEVRGLKNKDNKDSDAIEEEYVKLEKETLKKLLEVPTDLHAFTELNVANDIVEDIFSVFQEVEQAKGTGKNEKRKMEDLGYTKEEEQFELMKQAEGRLDDTEAWLKNDPDFQKVTAEGIDREEMPEGGVATDALATQVEDMIGDLLKENEKMEDDAKDGATTHVIADFPGGMGWDVTQGDMSSFAAKGKAGNQTPDHTEAVGRSNVGRQGMSNGETAAGSGTIGEGDKNIEARRTEDPTQSGKVDLAGKADTKATGGGKLASGKADDKGMSGGKERMDSNEQGSSEGMAAMMARQADAVYAKASLKNIRIDDLKTAAHHLRQAADAEAKGDIQQLREQQKVAVSSLRRAQADLQAGPNGAMEVGGRAGVLNDVIESGPDHAPAQYRDQVSDYYKALNDAL